MSAVRPAALAPPAVPPLPWWLLLAAVLTLLLKVHWLAGVAVAVMMLIQRARPLDFLTSYMLVVAVASFINYSAGHLTWEMTILTALLVFMLMCYALSRRWDALVIPRAKATLPLLLYLGMVLVNFVRGLAVEGGSPRYAGLELIAALALGTCLLVASRRPTEGEIKAALLWLWIVGLAHSALGFYIFSVLHIRTGAIYFQAVPGLIALLMFNYALREVRRSRMLLWIVAMGPLLMHQFLSFTRGFWIAHMVCILFSIAAYGGRQKGAVQRWKQGGLALGVLVGCGVLGAVVLAAALDISQIGMLAANRIASSGGTEYSWEASSNVVRLVEYVKVLEKISEAPVFGHGLGYFFVVREPIRFQLLEQWFTHEMYLYIWLKHGLLGLGLWLWLLLSFFRTGLAGRSHENYWEQSWCMGAATMVVFIAVYSFVHYPLAEVNNTFVFALTMGVSMRLTADGTVALRWKGRRTLAEPA